MHWKSQWKSCLWTCFTSLSKSGIMVVNAHLVSSSGWSWFRYLVLTIANVKKPASLKYIAGKSKRAIVACLQRSDRLGSFDRTFTQNWVRETIWNLSLHICQLCSSINYSAMPFICEWISSADTSMDFAPC